MNLRNHAAIAVAIGACVSLGLAIQVWAGADKVAFPEDYAKGVKYLVVDKPSKQVHEFYASLLRLASGLRGGTQG